MTENEDEYYFNALTLGGDGASVVLWDPKTNERVEDHQGGHKQHKLLINQVIVGPEAPDGELNVVQVEAKTWKGFEEGHAKTLIASLKAGGVNTQVNLNINLDRPVVFSLIKGTGPVHIIGQHRIRPMADDQEAEQDQMSNIDKDDDSYYLGPPLPTHSLRQRKYREYLEKYTESTKKEILQQITLEGQEPKRLERKRVEKARNEIYGNKWFKPPKPQPLFFDPEFHHKPYFKLLTQEAQNEITDRGIREMRESAEEYRKEASNKTRF